MTVRPVSETTSIDQFGSVVSPRQVTIGLLVAATLVLLMLRIGLVVAPLIAVAVIVLVAAVIDETTRRIPNRLVLVAVGLVVAGIPTIAEIQSVGAATVALGALTGAAISGAPILFLIWLLDPALIGGGDWKLLAAAGAALGLLVPIAAVLASLVACVFQFVRFAVFRERLAPFGPAIAAGMLVALATLPTISRLTGGELG